MTGGGGRAPKLVRIEIHPEDQDTLWEGDGELEIIGLKDGSGVHIRGDEKSVDDLRYHLELIPVKYQVIQEFPPELYIPTPLGGDESPGFLYLCKSGDGYLILRCEASGWSIEVATEAPPSDP